MKFLKCRPEGDNGYFYDGFKEGIEILILSEETPAKAAEQLAEAILWYNTTLPKQKP